MVSLEPVRSDLKLYALEVVVFVRLCDDTLPGPRRNSRPGLSLVACAPSLSQPYKSEAFFFKSLDESAKVALFLARMTRLRREEHCSSARSADSVVKLGEREPVVMVAPIALATRAAETGQNRPEKSACAIAWVTIVHVV